MKKSIKETQREVETNDPPIEVGQYWFCKSKGKILRRLRIIAEHPFPDYAEKGRAFIYEEHRSEMLKTRPLHELGVIPEFNLRFVFKLEK